MEDDAAQRPYNVDLMVKIREQITKHPETHDQEHWGRENVLCGTAHCIAGWAGALMDAVMTWTPYAAGWRELRYLGGQDPDDFAREALGLTDFEAGKLFYCGDNAKALVLLDEMIAAGLMGLRVSL